MRAGFQSLQLVITDFLLYLPPSSLPITVEVATQYGLQTVDINISLTCIGLLVREGGRGGGGREGGKIYVPVTPHFSTLHLSFLTPFLLSLPPSLPSSLPPSLTPSLPHSLTHHFSLLIHTVEYSRLPVPEQGHTAGWTGGTPFHNNKNRF